MGMLIEGRWVPEADRFIENGTFVRETSAFDHDLDAAVICNLEAEPGRYRLIASRSCPWSHRTLLVRAVKGLERLLPVTFAGGPRVEGYALQDELSAKWSGIRCLCHVHQLYSLSDPGFSGRATVPLLWDTARRRIVSNDSARIMRALDGVNGTERYTLVPGHLAPEIDRLNRRIHEGLGNAVYRAGLAQRQDAYDEAVSDVFSTLDELEDRLANQRFLFGFVVTESDWRLFATLVRFDPVYATHFRCTRRRLCEYPNLWAYARDLWRWPGVSETVDLTAILRGYYLNDGDHNPHGIVADAPAVDWSASHDRAGLGPAHVWSEETGAAPVQAGECGRVR
ncbi:MAG: glutathione S-transferase C-terminal domain-containing protein [Paracoccaceae bacterium]|nr:glutathione S-transferase C-terminal domain-containing protein [Paracoccaceae bacterium]